MSNKAFTATHTVQANANVAWEPVRTGLVSLMALTDPALHASADAWVVQTASRLTPEQLRHNRQVFAEHGNALLPALAAPDFPAFLAVLAGSRDADVRNLVVPHLREMWMEHLNAEWQRHAQQLRWLTQNALKQRTQAMTGSAIEMVRQLLRHDLPNWVTMQLAGATHVKFVLSPHLKLYVDRFDHPDTVYVFVQFENAMMRTAPLQRAEVLGPLVALADDSRLRLLELLAAHGEMRAQDVITRVGASQSNVSRHLKQLVGAGLVEVRRAGDANKRYQLRAEGVRALFGRIEHLLDPDNARVAVTQNEANIRRNAALAEFPADVRPYLNEHGQVTAFSTRPKEQKPVLTYLFGKIARGRTYTEREITDLIAQWLAPTRPRPGIDAVTLRRAMVDEMGLQRTKDGAKYWVT